MDTKKKTKKASMDDSMMHRRRTMNPPPPRLAWPAGGAMSSSNPSSSSETSSNRGTKRARRVTVHSPGSPEEAEQEAACQLWIDRYAPIRSSDLAVAPKKVAQVRSWIETAYHENASNKLLILVGSPGIGKSSMVRVLARELNLLVAEWNESYSTRTSGFRNDSMSIEQQTPLAHFEQFLQQAGAGYQSLVTEQDGSGSKRKQAPDDDARSSLILLEELPNLHGPQAHERFRDMMQTHLARSAVPTILIWSRVAEGKHCPHELHSLLDPSVLYSDVVQIINVQPVTKARLSKTLLALAKQQGLQLSTEYLQDLHLRSGGDVRFAITTLQYERGSSNVSGNHAKPKQEQEQHQRDTKLSTFHALGKLLYAKRQPVDATTTTVSGHEDEPRPPLAFDPEHVVERCDLELDGTLAFLSYHGPDFFTDCMDLEQACSYFSDAAVLLDCSNSASYAASLTSRAVANANRHPSASKFRQLSTPAMFDVLRKRRENWERLQQHVVHQPLGTVSSVRNFCTDCLPFVRIILPGVLNQGMHSHFGPVMEKGKRSSDDDQHVKVMLEQQAELLREDDICDYSSSDDDNNSNDAEGRPNHTNNLELAPSTKGGDPLSPNISPTSTIMDPSPMER